MSALSRRSLIATASALPALAVPAVAAAGATATWHTPVIAAVAAGATAEPDPTFEAIDAHRKALLEAMRTCRVHCHLNPRSPEYKRAYAIYEAAEDVELDAQSDLSAVVPTTRQGAVALINYITELYTGRVALPDEPNEWYACVDDDDDGFDHWIRKFEADDLLSPRTGKPLHLPLIYWVMQNICTALKTTVVQA